MGPYYIVSKIGDVDYKIRKGKNPNDKTDVVSRILPYFECYLPIPNIINANIRIAIINNNKNFLFRITYYKNWQMCIIIINSN